MAAADQNDPRVHFAAERTFLAWIRTGLGLMGFGFVVARFGLFLKELGESRPDLLIKSSGFSIWVGTALIIAGVIVTVTSTVSHIRLIDELNRGAYEVGRVSLVAVAMAVLLALVGMAMAAYLIVVR
jgi:putative membrane protein